MSFRGQSRHTARRKRPRRSWLWTPKQQFLERERKLADAQVASLPARMTDTRPTPLDDSEVARLFGLLGGADSVELKLTLPDVDHRSTARALGVDPLEAQLRQVFFFDTPELTLDRAGVVVRARRIQGRAHDSVIKLRPVVPDELADDLRRSPNVVVEVDAMPGAFVCSASSKGKLDQTCVQEAVAGRLPLRKLFSKEQRSFFAAHAPDGLSLDDLSVLGPISLLKLKLAPKTLGRRLVAEMWLYPDGGRIVELSTKCMPSEAFQVAAEARAYLTGCGIDLSGEQQTKTRAALEFFARDLATVADKG
jgi:hypothetical protein